MTPSSAARRLVDLGLVSEKLTAIIKGGSSLAG